MTFEQIKKLLTSDCLLVQFDPNKELILTCDISLYGLKAIHSHHGGPATGIHISISSNNRKKLFSAGVRGTY